MSNINDFKGIPIGHASLHDDYVLVRDGFGYPVYRRQSPLNIGDYVICVEEIDAFDGTGLPMFHKGIAYRVTNVIHGLFGISIELSTRPGCRVIGSMFVKSHLQVAKDAHAA